MRHKLIYLAILAIYFAISGKVYADEIVHIPDSAFKKALINMGVDRNKDGEIQYSEAEWYPGDWTPEQTRDGILYISKYAHGPIKDLTGIKAFTSITKIFCYRYYVSDSLDLSGMTNVLGIYVEENDLKYLDVSNCTALSTLNCRDNLLEKINISNCHNLTALNCAHNKLTYLNLKDYSFLYNIACYSNKLINIELPQNNILGLIRIMNNQISALDLSSYNNLHSVYVINNKLQKLNVANGNNQNIRDFNTTENSKLECITVDNPKSEWSKENLTNIDEWTMFSEDCNISVLETENINIKIYPNPANNNLFIEFNCEVKTDIEIYDIQGALQSTQTVQTGYNFVNLDVRKLRKGNYFVKINNQIKKIIIE